MSSNKNEIPHSIAVSNFDGTGKFEVKQGKKYTLSYDYRFERVGDDLQVAAMIDSKDKNANSLGRLIDSWDRELGDPFLWSQTEGQWVSTTFSFEARCDGYVFIVPFGWDKEPNHQKIWLDNIKIEEIQENKYVNAVISGANSTTQQTTATTPIIRRSIEGLTWIDRNSDGVQNDGSNRYISGVKVSLLKLKDGSDPTNEANYETYHYPGTNSPVTVETGKQVSVISQGSDTGYIPGRYRFMDLPKGTYAVRFEDGTGDIKIPPLIASPANRGEDDTLDSDGIAVYTNDRSALLRTYILNIKIPAGQMAIPTNQSATTAAFTNAATSFPNQAEREPTHIPF